MLHHIRPLYDQHDLRIADDVRQLMGHKAGISKPVEIKMMDFQFPGLVYLTQGEGRTCYPILATQSSAESSHKGRLASAQVRDKLNDLTAPKIGSEPLGELLGSFGAGGFGLPCLYGTHMPHIVTRGH